MTDLNTLRLAGKRAVITGGTSGLGLEMARRFIAEGAEVIITGSNPERTAAAAAEIGAEGVVADVRDHAQLGALAEHVRRRWGGLDVLVANAGIGVFAPIADVTPAAFDRQFDINVKGVFFSVQALLPLIGAGGSIVLIASGVNAKGAPGASLYFATKAAVRSFARSLAAELGPQGIRVNALSPGVVRTGFQERAGMVDEGSEAFIRSVIEASPLRREGAPEEIARAAVFLASDDSSYMAGSDVVVDGGYMNV